MTSIPTLEKDGLTFLMNYDQFCDDFSKYQLISKAEVGTIAPNRLSVHTHIGHHSHWLDLSVDTQDSLSFYDIAELAGISRDAKLEDYCGIYIAHAPLNKFSEEAFMRRLSFATALTGPAAHEGFAFVKEEDLDSVLEKLTPQTNTKRDTFKPRPIKGTNRNWRW